MISAMVLLALAALAIWLFNRMVRLRNQVGVAWSDVDVQLERRHDLVPALVETVKAYAGHESDILLRVTRERRMAKDARRPAEREAPEAALANDVQRLLALAEAYPELKSSDNFRDLAARLVEIEDTLQSARRFYNGSVRQYNTELERFPALLVARMFSFRSAEFFAADADARANVKVDLDRERRAP